VPAILFGIASYFYLPDGPVQASWLSGEEQRRVAADPAEDRAHAVKTTRSFGAALREPQVYVLAFIYFAFFCSLNTILLWTPTLLKRVGVATATEIGWLSGAISVASAIGMVAVGYSSDRLMERRRHVAVCGLVAAACFGALQLAAGSVLMTVVLLAIASVGIFAILSLFWTIPNAMLEGGAAAGGIALISAIGSFGGAICPALIGWISVATGSLYIPLAVVGALLAIGMLAQIASVGGARDPVVRVEPA
jgi:sugar phosphate permease